MFSSNCSSYFFVVLHCLPALFLVYFSIFCLRFSFITNSYVVIIAWASFCVVEQYNQYDMYMLCFSSVFLKHGICGVIWFIKTSTQISLCSCIIYFLSFLSVCFLFLENEEEKWKVLPLRVLLSFQSIVQIFFFSLPWLHFIPVFCVEVVISSPQLPHICQLLLWSGDNASKPLTGVG